MYIHVLCSLYMFPYLLPVSMPSYMYILCNKSRMKECTKIPSFQTWRKYPVIENSCSIYSPLI